MFASFDANRHALEHFVALRTHIGRQTKYVSALVAKALHSSVHKRICSCHTLYQCSRNCCCELCLFMFGTIEHITFTYIFHEYSWNGSIGAVSYILGRHGLSLVLTACNTFKRFVSFSLSLHFCTLYTSTVTL